MRNLELAVKYLAGNRLYGTDAERLALTGTNWYEFTSQENQISLTDGNVNYPFIIAHKNTSGSTQSTNNLTLYLSKKTGTPTSSTIYSAIWDDTSPNPVKQYDGSTMSTDDLEADSNGSFTAYNFTFDPARDVEADWSVGIWTDTTYSDPDFVYVAVNYSGGEDTQIRKSGASWTTLTADRLTTAIGTATDLNLPNGTTFLTSDTNKLYMWNGTDTWNEVA